MGGVTHIKTTEDLKAFFEKNERVIIDFYADWCGPCKRISPEIEKCSEAKDYKDIAFAKVNVDESEAISSTYSIEAMPTFAFFFKGKEVSKLRIQGADLKAVKGGLGSLLAEK